MIETESDLKSEVREQTGQTSTLTLSNDGLNTAFKNAKRQIRQKKSLDPSFDFFAAENNSANNALYWFTCLNVKVQLGELDAQDLQAGAVDKKDLLAKADDDVTTWHRNAYDALRNVRVSTMFRASSSGRSDRNYEPATYSGGEDSGAGSSDI
jgi:hypothetical protein